MSASRFLPWCGFAAAMLLCATPVDAANIFKCKNKDGTITVSNTPCAKGAEPDARLSRAAQAPNTPARTPCERVEEAGLGLVQIRSKLNPAQQRAVDAEAFGRMNSAGASRILAEITPNGTLRVCAFFGPNDTVETIIEPGGLVRRDGVVDADDPAASGQPPIQDGITMCTQRIDVCRSAGSALDDSLERCMRAIPVCSADNVTGCCPQACYNAYWRPPFEHIAGIKAMNATAACKSARGLPVR